jgi:hypothetical protein
MFSLTAQRVRDLLAYDPITGVFVWRVARGPVQAGTIAGSPNEWGHIRIKIDGHLYMAHQVAWLLMTGAWPSHQIDHRDTNPANNAWKNLRPATGSQNMANIGLRRDNKTGFKGVHQRPGQITFSASLRKNCKTIHLGTFKTAEEAHKAYCKAASEIHGEFANTGI